MLPLAQGAIEVGFCSFSDPTYYSATQPVSQLERWKSAGLNYNEETKSRSFDIAWSPDESLCGRMVKSYMLEVSSPNWFVNKGLQLFGKFPQNTCDEGSKANAATDCEGGCNACEQWADDKSVCLRELNSGFPVSGLMMKAVNLNINLRIRAYGNVEGGVDGEVEEEFWCLAFRKWKERGGGEEEDFDHLALIRG